MIKIEVYIASPQLVVPRGSTSQSSIVIDLGHISLFTGFFTVCNNKHISYMKLQSEEADIVLEKMCIQIAAMNVKSNSKGQYQSIVSHIDVSATVDRPVSRIKSPKLPEIRVLFKQLLNNSRYLEKYLTSLLCLQNNSMEFYLVFFGKT